MVLGVGLTGLCLAASRAPPCSITVSDYGSETLENLQFNVELNKSTSTVSVETISLDWCYPSSFSYLRPDIVLAADCTYSPDICISLVSCIQSILLNGGTNSVSLLDFISSHYFNEILNEEAYKKQPFALIASTLRNEETFYVFQREIESSQLHMIDITDWGATKLTGNLFFQSDKSAEIIKLFYIYVCSSKLNNK